MAIDAIGGRPIARTSGRPGKTGVWTLPGGGDAVAESAPSRLGTVALSGLDGLLALQEQADGLDRERRARKQGGMMLDALADLQRAMLSGGDPAATMRLLSDLTSGTPDGDIPDGGISDPGLAAILRAIGLRARVEMARVEMAQVEMARVELAQAEISPHAGK